jgi:hypothetical protein
MKYLFLLLLTFTVSLTSLAQSEESVYEIMDKTDISLQEAERRANLLFDKIGTGKGTGYKQFQRWKYERKFHVDENGTYISPVEEWNKYSSVSNTNKTLAGNWTELGPQTWNRTSGWNPGTGRISAMAIHPSNESIIYVGSPGGGIWKTTNGGTTWAPLIDNANSSWMSVMALTIDPNNQNVIYAALSGSAGIIKSINGGATWAQIATFSTSINRSKILIHPSNSNVVFVTTGNGIWRSTNAGTSWTQVLTASTEDIEFKPNDANVMYASGSTVWRSGDNGLSWTQITAAQGITSTGRTLVGVTPSNPDYVYVSQASGSSFGRMYKSTDAGLTFITTVVGNAATGTNYFGYETSGTGTGGQATYDMGLDVSPVNASEVYIAGIICWKSTNEGVSFFPQTAWSLPNGVGYNHADVHGLFWVNTTLYSISDGGIYKSINAGDDWTDLSAGLGIRQFYRFTNSQIDANVISGGAQDNGTVARQSAGNWVDWLGADGMESLVSPTNPLKLWGTSQNGSLYRSLNGGNSYSGLPRPSAGDWVTPLWIHPTNENILYGGWTGVYKSVDGGASWLPISSGIITTLVTDLAVAESNTNYIYASRGSTLYVTTDDGATWATRSAPANISDICIDPTDPNKIWVALISSTNSVMVSTNAGATFTNVSTGLPAISARTVVVDNNTPRGLYVGMNIGVYYKLETAASWTNFSDNLPVVAINELEIQHASGKIRVATYGRGVWESPVANVPPPSGFTFNNPAPAVATCPTPSTMSVTLGTNIVGSFANPVTLSATAGIPAGTTVTFGTNPVAPGNSSVVTLNNANALAAGNYVITVSGAATGVPTQTRNITYTINAGSGPVIGTQPSNQNICVGGNATFSIAATSATSYQWQERSNGGTTWNNIPTATSTSITIPSVTVAMNGTQYRCNAINSCGTTTSSMGTLAIIPAASISLQPASVNACSGSNAQFCITASGNNLTYQWETAADCLAPFTNVAGATNACLNITNAVTSAVYRCKVASSCGVTLTSTCAQLTIGALAVVTQQPTDKEICANSNTSLSVNGTSAFAIMYQWQVSSDGGNTWGNINGATSNTLSLPNVTATQNNYRYRSQLSTTACPASTNSNAAVLTIRSLPTIGLTATPKTSLLPGQTTVLQATPSVPTVVGNVVSKVWLKDNVPFSNTGNSYTANVEKLGSYKLTIAEKYASGLECTNSSPIVNLTAPSSNQLFIFPTPNDGTFTLSYYNDLGASTKRTVAVYDSKGSRVFNKQMAISGPYTLLNIDIKPAQSGIYTVLIVDAAGSKLAKGRIFVR